MNARVEDLAHKMVKARQIRDEASHKKKSNQAITASRVLTQEGFFKRKAEMAEREAQEKEKRIKEME